MGKLSQPIGAIDVGGTKIAVGLVQDGKVLSRREVPTTDCLVYSQAVEKMAQMLEAMQSEIGCALAGIGIGLTGRVENETRKIGRNDFLKDWEGRDLVTDLESQFHVQAAIENDADAAALAEAYWGTGKGKGQFIYLTVSTGIGGGIVLHGHLYRGIGGSHPEIGHHVIDPNGPQCFCGASGCWESMASGTAMLRWTLENIPAARDIPGLDTRQICDLAEQRLPWAQAVIEHEGVSLGIGLANLVTLFAPEQIALGGGLMRRWPLFEPFAMHIVQHSCHLVPVEKIRVSPAQLGDETPLIGAAQVWVHQFATDFE
jgi:glucokinase